MDVALFRWYKHLVDTKQGDGDLDFFVAQQTVDMIENLLCPPTFLKAMVFSHLHALVVLFILGGVRIWIAARPLLRNQRFPGVANRLS